MSVDTAACQVLWPLELELEREWGIGRDMLFLLNPT